MTRQFSVKDEIEVKDDVDNKPDGCEKLAAKAKEKQQRFSVDDATFVSYSEVIADISSTIKQLNSTQLYFKSRAYGDASLPEYVSISFDGKPLLQPAKTRRKLENEILFLSRIFPSALPEVQNRFEFELAFNSSEFVTTAKLLRHNDVEAHQAFIAYDSTLDLWRCTARTQSEALISKSTEFSWVNNQVLVVTRLPRGSLNMLLASDVK